MRQGSVRSRIPFLDTLRVVAIFMVIVVHSCEQFYFGGDGNFFIASLTDARWVVGLDSAVRACVPLFVIASAYLLFPVARPTGAFLKRRLLRVGVPFAIWCCVYTWWNGGEWLRMVFNFPLATGGHLWFVPMIVGLYLLMPLLSPWAERVTERELRGWIVLWLVTTAFPFLRLAWGAIYGVGWSHAFGYGDFGKLPFLYGECAWNGFGTFHYVSGFVGYMLVGFYARKFLPELSWRKTLAVSVPLALVGWAIVAGPFYSRILPPGQLTYPVSQPYALAVELETSWEFCSTGVAMTVIAYFLVLRKLAFGGAFGRFVVCPLAAASYGVYLIHILVLCPVVAALRPHFPTPVTIGLASLLTFAFCSLACLFGRRLPWVGRWIFG